jgi:hypothetical protein
LLLIENSQEMKNLSIILFAVILAIVLNSCKKERFQRLPEGEYDAVFTVQSGNYFFNPCYGTIEILESNDSYIIVKNAYLLRDNDTLYRSDNTITGTLHWHGANSCTGHNTFYDDYSVTGSISKENGVFQIIGGLTTTITEPHNNSDSIWEETSDAFGTFVLKSIF